MEGEELNLCIYIMPCKQMLTVGVKLNDSIKEVKRKLSVTINYPAEQMKIVNGGRPCDDLSTVKEIGLNYCSRVICAAKGYQPNEETAIKRCNTHDSKLLIKMDGSNSYDVPYNMSTTWRQLKIALQRVAHINPLDFVILLNDNKVDDNDTVSSAHVNYMSIIHAVRTDFNAILFKPIQKCMIYLTCPHCKRINPDYVIRPLCTYCLEGYVELTSPFSLATTEVKDCFHVTGICRNDECCKRSIECPVALAFYCKSCSLSVSSERPLILALHPTESVEEMKVQLNKLYGY